MGRLRDACWLAALSVCLGCGSSEGNGKAAAAETGDAATTSTSDGAGGTATGFTATGADSTGTTDSGGTAANTGGSGAGDTNAGNTSTSGAGTGGDVSLPRTETHACLEYVRAFCEQTARCDGTTSVLSCFESASAGCPD